MKDPVLEEGQDAPVQSCDSVFDVFVLELILNFDKMFLVFLVLTFSLDSKNELVHSERHLRVSLSLISTR